MARSKRGIERIRDMAAQEREDDVALIADPFFARKIAELEIDPLRPGIHGAAHARLGERRQGAGAGVELAQDQGHRDPAAHHRTGAWKPPATTAAPYFRGFPEGGDNALPIGPDYAHRAAPTYFNVRKTSIYGGSNEIQRNIIAKMVLGL